MSNLSLEAKDCQNRAKQYLEELSRNLERMEAKTLSDINVFKTQESKTITQQIDTCKAAQNSLEMYSRKLQLAKEQNDRQGIFMYNIQLSQAVKSFAPIEPRRRHCVVSLSKNINPSLVLVQPRKTRPFVTERLLMGRKESNQTKTNFAPITEEITKEVYQPHISFECNPAISFAGNQDLGTVRCHTFRTPQMKGFDKMSITAGNKINVKLQSDAKDAYISGSTFLSSGELVLCDYYNNKLKLLDKSLQMKESIDLPGSPWDVAPVNQHQVIVTFPHEQHLQFIQVTPSLALGHKVELGMECRGVTVSRESIYLSFDDSGECKVGIYDLTGKKKCIISPYNCKHGSNLQFKNPLYIDVLNDEKYLYLM